MQFVLHKDAIFVIIVHTTYICMLLCYQINYLTKILFLRIIFFCYHKNDDYGPKSSSKAGSG